jgi:hypothetical protein
VLRKDSNIPLDFFVSMVNNASVRRTCGKEWLAMHNPKHGAVRILRIKPTDDLKTIYAKVKRSFTAADLQKFTETEEGIPAEEVVAKLEALANGRLRKRKKS